MPFSHTSVERGIRTVREVFAIFILYRRDKGKIAINMLMGTVEIERAWDEVDFD